MITAHACSQSPALQVSGLQPGTAYHFRVQARNRPGCGPWCEVLPVHTKADVSEAPMSVVVARRTPGGFTVRWELPEEDNGNPIKTYRFDAHAPSSAAQPVCQSLMVPALRLLVSCIACPQPAETLCFLPFFDAPFAWQSSRDMHGRSAR